MQLDELSLISGKNTKFLLLAKVSLEVVDTRQWISW